MDLERDEGRHDAARALVSESLVMMRLAGEAGLLSIPAAMVGMLDIAAGGPARGVTIVAACTPPHGPIGTVQVPEVRFEAPIFLARARALLGEAAYDAVWERGRGMSLRDGVDLALSPPTEAPLPGEIAEAAAAV